MITQQKIYIDNHQTKHSKLKINISLLIQGNPDIKFCKTYQLCRINELPIELQYAINHHILLVKEKLGIHNKAFVYASKSDISVH